MGIDNLQDNSDINIDDITNLFVESVDSAQIDIDNFFINNPIYNIDNTLIVVFHAGLGQDIEAGIFDPTIFDIHSAYIDFNMLESIVLIFIAGFLVGLGTRMSGGCTSGHGICGISRFSIRSVIATITFIISGVVTVFILQNFGIHL